MINTFLLIIAIVTLTVNIILTIAESIERYHEYFPSAEHPGRIRGACVQGPDGKCSGWVEIDGMRYNVEWYLIGRKEDEESGK